MYAFFGISALKQLRPYFRKYISGTLEAHEYMFLNAVFVLGIMIIYKIVLCVNTKKSFSSMFTNYKNMNLMQIGCMFILASVAVITTLAIFHLDKNYNTPLLNSVYMQAFGIVILLIVGIFLFREQYTWKHIVGILLILLGIYITNS